MSDELLVVFTRLLNPSSKQDELLDPIRRLKEIVGLEAERHLAMGIVDPEILGLKDCTDQLSFSKMQKTYTK
jgi:hypothetical protein